MGRSKRKPKKLKVSIDKNNGSDLKKNIDILSRLSFPVSTNTGQFESEDDTDDEETIEFDFRPRKTYLSNTCLVCSHISNPKLVCKNCFMVSYCTEDHRSQDAALHQDFCRALAENCQEKCDGIDDRKNTPSPEEYRILRVNLIKVTEIFLNRYLELWEKEVILYPRVCFKCHSFGKNKGASLQCCSDCKVVFWCQEHRDDHSEWCLQYQLFHKLILAQATHGNVDPGIPNVYFMAPKLSQFNFDTVASMISGNDSDRFINMDFYNYTTLSHMASVPLTALYALQESYSSWKSTDNIVLHLIGAEFQYEGINLRVWEKLFLHFLPNLKTLRVIITGPELILPQLVPRDILSHVKLCRLCKLRDRKIDVSFVPETLYHDFCYSPNYKKPDLTCLFNAGLYRTTGFRGQDTWPRTIFELCKSKVPILVTAYTEREIPMDIERIKGVCSDLEIVLAPQKNPYASLKPDRNFVSDESVPLIYKNYYLSIVRVAG
ncbi:uncharacterized protein LOC107217282 [Neodiprion lecontei]|uniref:Uncharacterized protein LOC107217282 n=1 Tax=Neodiprion lecontei TaxID=441921 RepID=A0A6J0B5A4_NEOLC|nr:uncharacterized protein LOC107217282 [Neodiprion lecontei]XP_046596828.1 uncharacterized protein LOC107217282 [Neodiprion lecontei]